MEEPGSGVELSQFSTSYHLPKDPDKRLSSLNFTLLIYKMGMITLLTQA